MSLHRFIVLWLNTKLIAPSWSLHSGTDSNNPTWKHHLETFGKVWCVYLTCSVIPSVPDPSSLKLSSVSWRDRQSLNFLQDVVYDDFIANFTGSHFNASEWLDLFDDAGAKYFVLTTVSPTVHQ